jgi:hypothetical protein
MNLLQKAISEHTSKIETIKDCADFVKEVLIDNINIDNIVMMDKEDIEGFKQSIIDSMTEVYEEQLKLTKEELKTLGN